MTKYYLEDAEPGRGNIDYELGFDKTIHSNEIDMAKWLNNTLGGNVLLISERDDVKTPDFLWNEALWDLKTTTTAKAANSAIKSGMRQIKTHPGGIILDYGNNEFSLEELHKIIDLRMQWYPRDSADIMIIANGELIEVLRY